MGIPESWIVNRLIADGQMTGFVSGNVYPVYVKQDTSFPFVTYKRTGTKRDNTTRGSDGVPQATIQVVAWALDYEEGKRIADRIRKVVKLTDRGEEFQYQTDTGTDKVFIRKCFLTDESDIDEFPPIGRELPFYGVQLTFDITYTELLA